MTFRIASHKEFSRLPRGLGLFADSNSIPWNQPTIFRPSRVATILLMFLLLFVVQLVQQFRLSQIDEVSKFGDSTIILHRICHTPKNCQSK